MPLVNGLLLPRNEGWVPLVHCVVLGARKEGGGVLMPMFFLPMSGLACRLGTVLNILCLLRNESFLSFPYCCVHGARVALLRKCHSSKAFLSTWTGCDDEGEGCGERNERVELCWLASFLRIFDTVSTWFAPGTRVTRPFFCATLFV